MLLSSYVFLRSKVKVLKLYVIKNFVVSILSKVTSLGLGKGQEF